MPHRRWSHDELLVTFNLYCRTPFGKMHQKNPDIVELAKAIGRTPSAVAMKLTNFASLDPEEQRRGVKGLTSVSKNDREIWDAFHSDWEQLAYESQQAKVRLLGAELLEEEKTEFHIPSGPTEREALTRVRVVQGFFRETVLASYERSCAICAIAIPELIIASHIIPWSLDEKRRADPRNGLALCAIHDRAFDRGLISIDAKSCIMISKILRIKNPPELHQVALLEIEGVKIRIPRRFTADPEAISYHRENIFQS